MSKPDEVKLPSKEEVVSQYYQNNLAAQRNHFANEAAYFAAELDFANAQVAELRRQLAEASKPKEAVDAEPKAS